MTDAPLHPEVEALVIGTPTCRHGNFTEQDLRRIALLAAAKAREEQLAECIALCYANGQLPGVDVAEKMEAIRRVAP